MRGSQLYTTTAPSCCIPASYCHLSATLQTTSIVAVNLQADRAVFRIFIALLRFPFDSPSYVYIPCVNTHGNCTQRNLAAWPTNEPSLTLACSFQVWPRTEGFDIFNSLTSGIPRNFVRGEGVSTNSVEDTGQRERGSGGGSPLDRGFEGSCNLVQEISFHIVKTFLICGTSRLFMTTTNLFVIANVKQLRTGGSFRILLPFFQTSLCVGVLNSAIFNSFHNLVEFDMILEGLPNFRGGGWAPQTPLRYATDPCMRSVRTLHRGRIWSVKPAPFQREEAI